MTLSRRSFSFAAAAGLAAAAVPRASRAAAAEPRFLLVVSVRGAWDVTWCLDPKRGPRCDVPAGDITSFAAGHKILTHADRPAIRTFFDAHAARAAVINGIWIGSVAHTSARIRILTGTRSARNPDVAALFAADAVKKNPALALPYVDLGGGAYAGPHASLLGRVGTTNQLVTLLDRARAFKDPAHPVFHLITAQRHAGQLVHAEPTRPQGMFIRHRLGGAVIPAPRQEEHAQPLFGAMDLLHAQHTLQHHVQARFLPRLPDGGLRK